MNESSQNKPNYLTGWLQLVRLPNLLTVPGDVLAGVAVMVGVAGKSAASPAVGTIVAACGASVLLYIVGLLCNDLVDQARDAEERPSRPLPSGVVPRSHAIVGFLVSVIGAILLGFFLLPLAAFGCEVALLGVILIYNSIKQKFPLAGGVVMGLCRGLNLLLGAAILVDGRWTPFFTHAVPIAACWTAYIFAVTLVAQRETDGQGVQRRLALPVVVLLAFIATFFFVIRPTEVLLIVQMAIYLAMPLVMTFAISLRIYLDCRPKTIQDGIGGMISNLIFMQAAVCISWPGLGGITAPSLMMLWILNNLLCRRFYAS
ncbi:MAG: UbiA family prenyltransferase [Planctomycetia bacterium]|jgi:4-hydroxybenzoate polyprenyltransferase